jgi:hypothetical protein
VCGWLTTSEFMVCQRNPACRKELHRRADKPKAKMSETLALILHTTIPEMPIDVARDIASCMERKSKKSVIEALLRFRTAIELNETRTQKK